jgi:uncharacterized protein (DUF2147 family)
LYGRFQNLVDPDPDDPNPTCEGDQQGQPVIGLRILWDLQKDGDGWSGGTILDPAVRGFIGLSLLGRTQYWLRE